jgi:HEAT repeat protein
MASANPGVAKAAREAITTMTHGSPRKAEVVQQLLALAQNGPPMARVLAYRNLSLIAGEDSVPIVAKAIHDPELREEVVFCLERIPGQASNKALLGAYKETKDDFKPRILAALGHRRVEEAAPLCAQAMRSSNKELAVAAVKAYGRIGHRAQAVYPDAATLGEWQKIDQMDSLLRFADAQASRGNSAEAIKIYRTALDRSEEHWQCAGIIGLAKLGTAEAASLIFPKLKNPNDKVRITARNAWRSMA